MGALDNAREALDLWHAILLESRLGRDSGLPVAQQSGQASPEYWKPPKGGTPIGWVWIASPRWRSGAEDQAEANSIIPQIIISIVRATISGIGGLPYSGGSGLIFPGKQAVSIVKSGNCSAGGRSKKTGTGGCNT